MPTHFMQTDDGVRPYAYCPDCGWAMVCTDQAKADAADAAHKCETSSESDDRFDDDGQVVDPMSTPAK